MRSGATLSLFATYGKHQLFSRDVLNRYVDQHKTTVIPNHKKQAESIAHWLDALKNTTATELSLEAKFYTHIFGEVLGYSIHPAPSATSASLYIKPPMTLTKIKRSPDAILGDFSAADVRFEAVIEVKSPGTDFDKPQSGYQNHETPVEQAFSAGEHILGVKWVIVSDMRIIRLYSIDSQGEYEEFDLKNCFDTQGNITDSFRRLHFLLHYQYFMQGYENSSVNLLYGKSTSRRIEIRDSFYQGYYAIRSILYNAVKQSSANLQPQPTRADLLAAVQRLLDRLLFIYYCEDHPQQLIENGTVEKITKAARMLPGSSNTKVYATLKSLFREVDSGSPAGSGQRIDGYNGELFKDHWIIDHIELPDSLHDKTYDFPEPNGKVRRIHGVWGFHVYDFWTELNEHLLGHIFEESLSDIGDLGTGRERPVSERLKERKEDGIYYTNSILSEFLSESALRATLNEAAPLLSTSDDDIIRSLKDRLDYLSKMRVIDFACGSGAFLVSVYQEISQEYWRLRTSLLKMQTGANASGLDLFTLQEATDQASLLRECLFGVDKLPQAVEIAKLALWLRSARKNEKVANLGGNILASDSLDVEEVFAKLQVAPGSFDLVIGNPPWGGEVVPGIYQRAIEYLGLPTEGNWDTWELFVVLALKALREGGRIAFVLPDSFFYSEKTRVRKILLASATLEKVHKLGPGWFGSKVRMDTIIVQARRGKLDINSNVLCALLVGKLREQAIQGKVPLLQIEAQRSRLVPLARSIHSSTAELEVFRGVEDDLIMERMLKNSSTLEALCDRTRGEEFNKAGLVWECPSCQALTTPGTKNKGGGYKDKICPNCSYTLTVQSVNTANLVKNMRPLGPTISFIDGDDVNHRYQRVIPSKWLTLNVSGWPNKPDNLYTPPKILIRQAGVGLIATLDETNSRCPQSVYIYRLKMQQTANGYRHEFVLGALLSRTMAYYIFKRFSEVDPAKAHAKLTHQRLAGLPIPKVDFSDTSQKAIHASIVANVRNLLAGSAVLGGREDNDIELALRNLWGISTTDGAYINGEFYDLPDSQIIRDLFPKGCPKPVTVSGIQSTTP